MLATCKYSTECVEVSVVKVRTTVDNSQGITVCNLPKMAFPARKPVLEDSYANSSISAMITTHNSSWFICKPFGHTFLQVFGFILSTHSGEHTH